MMKTDPEASELNPDFRDMVLALQRSGARFLVVGAHALAAHGIPRATDHCDVLVEPTTENAQRILATLAEFGAPAETHGVCAADFQRPGMVYQIGLPPRRIDLLTGIDGVDFREAWEGRLEIVVQGLQVPVLGRAELIRNKLATGRDKDKVDINLLRAQERG